MLAFTILKKSKKSRARLGLLATKHGMVETPAFVGVATQAVVKTLSSEEAEAMGCQMLIANTYHLHIRPDEKIVKAHGGLHAFMNWRHPLMTDSGGFQVFSLGFGKDLGMSKMLKHKVGKREELDAKAKPTSLRITEDGVVFRSYVDGKEIFLGPKESMNIQGALGADIIFAFDECPPPVASHEYMKQSVERTHRWAEICLREKKKTQALYGIVQGGKHADLRTMSATFFASKPFDGYGIGGEFGVGGAERSRMLRLTIDTLPDEKPRHLLGTGYIEDIARLIKEGVDTFDSIVPTHYARHGTAFTSAGKLDLGKSVFLKDTSPLDPTCACPICKHYSRGYIAHLFRAHEITPLKLLTMHNLWFFNAYVASLREKIKKGQM
ncbi:MAG: hypothetical protein A3J54_01565 [Candidatus Ryanbacteria bacterium RIFCSPHIGHO2_02_FULL_45_13b]|uniref:Queuine tRNA-ribosyltransferase n=1 Tax=Candidatus Ryanbacteria bacterium RIFCSPHIGHO2_02_FULL_45_13b TaxID=1802117 RepID=A0A1G2GAQ6_9BACT|nr:MAG: hypothetical protein A3J54_01565 [Candidatus Ryanbacteria bacterium RIFCSPHIGHO2_02_FULL_45_13b]